MLNVKIETDKDWDKNIINTQVMYNDHLIFYETEKNDYIKWGDDHLPEEIPKLSKLCIHIITKKLNKIENLKMFFPYSLKDDLSVFICLNSYQDYMNYSIFRILFLEKINRIDRNLFYTKENISNEEQHIFEKYYLNNDILLELKSIKDVWNDMFDNDSFIYI
jgi:hypothetical protein